MQRVKLNAGGIVDRHGSEVADRGAQRVHAGNDPELREQGKRKHQADQHVPAGEKMRGSIGEATVEERADEVNDPGKDGDPMQLAQRTSNDVAREMRVRQNLKRGWREYEGKEDQTADPADESQQH